MYNVISQVRLWALQLIMVSTPSLLVALHVGYREHREAKHGKKLYSNKGSIDGGLLATYIVSLIFKTTFEVGSLVTFYVVYNGFRVPRLLQCNQEPCPNMVDCYVARPTEKTIFLYIMGCTSIICICLNITEMLYIIFKQCWKCFSKRYVPIRERRPCHCADCSSRAQVLLTDSLATDVVPEANKVSSQLQLKQEEPSS